MYSKESIPRVKVPVCSEYSTKHEIVFSAMLFGTIFILLGLTEGQDCPGKHTILVVDLFDTIFKNTFCWKWGLYIFAMAEKKLKSSKT